MESEKFNQTERVKPTFKKSKSFPAERTIVTKENQEKIWGGEYYAKTRLETKVAIYSILELDLTRALKLSATSVVARLMFNSPRFWKGFFKPSIRKEFLVRCTISPALLVKVLFKSPNVTF